MLRLVRVCLRWFRIRNTGDCFKALAATVIRLNFVICWQWGLLDFLGFNKYNIQQIYQCTRQFHFDTSSLPNVYPPSSLPLALPLPIRLPLPQPLALPLPLPFPPSSLYPSLYPFLLPSALLPLPFPPLLTKLGGVYPLSSTKHSASRAAITDWYLVMMFI